MAHRLIERYIVRLLGNWKDSNSIGVEDQSFQLCLIPDGILIARTLKISPPEKRLGPKLLGRQGDKLLSDDRIVSAPTHWSVAADFRTCLVAPSLDFLTGVFLLLCRSDDDLVRFITISTGLVQEKRCQPRMAGTVSRILSPPQTTRALRPTELFLRPRTPPMSGTISLPRYRREAIV